MESYRIAQSQQISTFGKHFHNVRCHSEFRCLHYIVQILCKRVQREFTLNLPSAAKYYANTLQTSAKRVYSQFAECS